MSDQDVLLNTAIIPLRWVDLDAYGHVTNAKFFEFMTEARVQILLNFLEEATAYQFILADASCNFKQPLHFPGSVEVQQFVTALGNASFSLYYLFKRTDDPDTIYAEGTAKMVCFDPKLSKTARVPERLRNFLSKSA
jgi:acyl-CoA thioester hydrolase